MGPHRSSSILIALLLVALAACGGDDGGTVTSTAPSTTVTTGTTTSTEAPAAQAGVRAYFLRQEKVGPVARRAEEEATAAEAVNGLLSGPTPAEAEIGFFSTVPAGTRLLGIVVEDRVATVDLSGEFTSGGGSASMRGRVAQVVFTLTQFPAIEAVRFEVDHQPLTVLGGEGIMLDQPQRRSHWEDFSPAILVESPLPFADVADPLRVTGSANTFEAVFWIKVSDGGGATVADQRAMATSGTGTRGTFDVNVPLDGARPGTGMLAVYERSARDGSPINVVEIPIRLSAGRS